jgi:hypothetical protein
VSAPEAPEVRFDSKLVEVVDDPEPLAINSTSWFITHGLGGPAEGTFTEVAFDGETTETPLPVTEAVLEAITRTVAVQLYGRAWAFVYRPDQYASSIERHGMRRRERVVVSGIEVFS